MTMRALAIIAILFGAAPLCLSSPTYGVYQMKIIEKIKNCKGENARILEEILQRANLEDSVGRPKLLKGFSWKECGNSTAANLGKINSFSVSPDPLKLPGELILKFDVELKETVDAPLQAELKISKKVGSISIPIPCIDGIGSCNYTDVCEQLRYAVCPKPFDDNKIPCKCPFPKGTYSMPTSSIKVQVSELPGGDYEARIQLWYKKQPVNCVDLTVSIV